MTHVLVLVRLALRGVLREARRSLLTASAMVVGLGLLIISRAIADGAHEDWIDVGVRLASGHVAVQAEGFLESGSLDHRLTPTALGRTLDALARPEVAPDVAQVVTRLSVSGLASSPTSALPVLIEGVDPGAEASFSTLADQLVEGRYLEEGDRLSAYVGAALAERLDLRVGSRFVLTAQDASGDIQGQLVRVTGLYRTGLLEMDEGLIHIPLDLARQWLSAPDEATTVGVLLHSSDRVPAVVETLREILDAGATDDGDGDAVGADDGLRVLSWREAVPELDSAVRIDDYGDWAFHTILFAIVALAILNAIHMSVLHRKREFGVLQALGLSPGETGVLVFLEGLLLTMASGFVGMGLGFAITWIFWRDGLDLSFLMDQDLTFSGIVFDPVMVPRFRPWHVAQSVGFMIVIGVLASLYPAHHAARLDPAEAVKWEG